MIQLTGYNNEPVYVRPRDIAAIEPTTATEPWLSIPISSGIEPPDGSVVTLSAGRTIVVREASTTIYAWVRDALTTVQVSAGGPAR